MRLLCERVVLVSCNPSDNSLLMIVLEMCLRVGFDYTMIVTTDASGIELEFNEKLVLMAEMDDAKVVEVLMLPNAFVHFVNSIIIMYVVQLLPIHVEDEKVLDVITCRLGE